MEELIAPASKLISYRVLDTKDELIVVGYSPTKCVHSIDSHLSLLPSWPAKEAGSLRL